MFIGEYSHNLDDKGRLSIPAKFRRELTGGLVVTRGLDHCLWLYPKDEWEEMAKRLAALPVSQANSRAFARLMLAGAWDAELDSQGRVIIPEYLRSFATLDKKITVAGLYNRVEIWDEAKWAEYKSKAESESESIAEAMGELGV